MDAAKPSSELVRSLTDEHVLRAFLRHRRLTRAELATLTGISKPTAGESVRRLTERGLVVDTGERTPGGRGRGRVGSYYALTPDAGTALAVSIAPEGVGAERVDAYGQVLARAERTVSRPARPTDVATALRAALADLGPAAPGTPRLAVVSAADPVHRSTGRLIHLPDAPFLVGELDPVGILTPHVTGPVVVDNDVNWAAQAERAHGAAEGLDHFAYLHLGEGLGCAIVTDGEVRRGHHGIAGEIAHLVTTGPAGEAIPFIEVFGRLGLRRDASTAIDVARLLAAATPPGPVRDAVVAAVDGVLAAIVALGDPELVVVGGSWGPALVEAIRTASARSRRPVPVRAADLTDEPSLAGARDHALASLRAAIVATAHQPPPPTQTH
ncbi:ROK family transcriptional regulator [Micromonospora krabiensis]|uniref:Sugar kinase of the NBD/HSP70 family, may contain an N-terminal HTH domain n=1 Tax=Micromonospora krabiensis TaxID=307121 RepID=A0A1C3MYD1_9ACTN|nr:ROK family transcriptional regulator [Micromonospora krabiensis]SBV25343.1 Sugar kinase of the NBD/HSP70 family, may contain an N-terminal HTH domain [Micromonospora krabiensis]